LEEVAAAQGILDRYLFWLVDKVPGTLASNQQDIRRMLTLLLNKGAIQRS
jgi:hypothetical protein